MARLLMDTTLGDPGYGKRHVDEELRVTSAVLEAPHGSGESTLRPRGL